MCVYPMHFTEGLGTTGAESCGIWSHLDSSSPGDICDYLLIFYYYFHWLLNFWCILFDSHPIRQICIFDLQFVFWLLRFFLIFFFDYISHLVSRFLVIYTFVYTYVIYIGYKLIGSIFISIPLLFISFRIQLLLNRRCII